MSAKKRANPFYILLVLAGVAFIVTGCAYGVVGLRELGPRSGSAAQSEENPAGPHPLATFMNEHGLRILGWEVGVLAVATIGAMWLDSVRDRQDKSATPGA